MIVKYSLHVVCRCPKDREPDLYRVEIESHRTIFVEEILAFVRTLDDGSTHLAQEQVTEMLARRFLAKVTTYGNHSGVSVECTA
jgi:hypothetical protein